ncbi:hypothetical protein OIE68_09195 [Nocardia vinacea]|uniref:hypothetical protein n=1 Tax=Nocardia vinacea TaxID=96468 RepID=UPI002E11553E|nr:hypothetical protein OIE68_09195 [Nocardia vinacea]
MLGQRDRCRAGEFDGHARCNILREVLKGTHELISGIWLVEDEAVTSGERAANEFDFLRDGTVDDLLRRN